MIWVMARKSWGTTDLHYEPILTLWRPAAFRDFQEKKNA